MSVCLPLSLFMRVSVCAEMDIKKTDKKNRKKKKENNKKSERETRKEKRK